MSSALIVLQQMIVLFGIILLGYFIYKKGIVNKEQSAVLSKLVVNIFNPFLIINGVMTTLDVDSKKLWTNIALVVIYFVIMILTAVLTSWLIRPKQGDRTLYSLMGIFSNVGFMGIPVLRSLYGDAATVYVAFYVLGYNILLYTLGTIMAEKSGKEYAQANGEKIQTTNFDIQTSLKKMINPGVIACLVALVVLLLNREMPYIVVNFVGYLGNVAVPMSMLLIGISFAQIDLREIISDIRPYLYILLKMVVVPICVAILMKIIAPSVDPIITGVFVLEFAMPIGNIVTLIATEKGANAGLSSMVTILTTLASVITIPIVCLFL